MYPTPTNNFYEFQIPKKEVAPAGQVYLGTFLAFSLFFSFFFGNLLFFLIVLIISIFIFLEKEVDVADPDGNIFVGFYETGLHFAKKDYSYSDMLSFTFHDEIFGEKVDNLRITFKSPGKTDLFVPLPPKVQKKFIYDIILKHVREDKNKLLTLTEQIVLRFF